MLFRSQAPFSKTTGAAIVDGFATALEWAERAASEGGDGTTRGDIVREAAAAEVLIAGLLAGKAGRWAEAVSALEYALEEHGGSLLVLLLSDGTDIWETPSTPPAEEETIEGPDGESD